jgi:hypothetical protein
MAKFIANKRSHNFGYIDAYIIIHFFPSLNTKRYKNYIK